MKTAIFAIFAIFATFTTACAGQAFTTAEEAMRLPSTEPTVVVAVTPEAEPANVPDAGPSEAQDASPSAVAPDAGTPEADASPNVVEAAATQPDAQAPDTQAPDAGPTGSGLLCTSETDPSLFTLTPQTLDFEEVPVGSSLTRSIVISDGANCSTPVDTTFNRPQGEYSTTSNCGTITPGQPCLITVTFAPTGAGPVTVQGDVTILGQVVHYTVTGRGE
jgi:hypothetical protein